MQFQFYMFFFFVSWYTVYFWLPKWILHRTKLHSLGWYVMLISRHLCHYFMWYELLKIWHLFWDTLSYISSLAFIHWIHLWSAAFPQLFYLNIWRRYRNLGSPCHCFYLSGVRVENRQVMVNKEMPTVTSAPLQSQIGQMNQTDYKETPIMWAFYLFYHIHLCSLLCHTECSHIHWKADQRLLLFCLFFCFLKS